MKRREHKGFKEVIFGAGRAFDAFGRATSFWTGVVTYQWDVEKQAFHVCAVQDLGTGTAVNSNSHETILVSCDEVNSYLDYFKELETHYKKVYGE